MPSTSKVAAMSLHTSKAASIWPYVIEKSTCFFGDARKRAGRSRMLHHLVKNRNIIDRKILKLLND